MLNEFARASVSKAIEPLGSALARLGLHPNVVTVIGTAGSIAGAVLFLGRGQMFLGTVVITLFVLLDLVDGALARASGKGSKFGAVLDSTCDRLADAAICGSILWWYAGPGDSPALVLASLLALVLGQVTSYVKARAEGLGLHCDVGLAERAERLILILVGAGLDGLGVSYVLAAALWLLVFVSGVTVAQRMVAVFQQSSAEVAAAAAAGTQPDGGGAQDGSTDIESNVDNR